jgi:hypothetical protein
VRRCLVKGSVLRSVACLPGRSVGEAKWRGGPEAGARGAGAVGVGGCAWLRWPVAGLRCVSLARLRCTRAVWAAAGLPPGSDLFQSGVGVGGGPSPAPAGRVSEERQSARHGVPAWPPARGVCSSRGGGGASDSRAIPEDFRRNVRHTARPTARRSQSIPVTRMRWSVTPTQHAACACDV